MTAKLLDVDSILSGNEQWMKLDQDWKPIDLETDEEYPVLSPVLSCLDLRKSTFDSSFLFKKVRRNLGRQLSKKSLNYKDFLEDLKDENVEPDLPLKQFYFIGGQIISALSVEEICDTIDDIFKSIERLNSATSTIRLHKKEVKLPDVVQCSISACDFSFDDTIEGDNVNDSDKEKNDNDDVDRFIDEAFDHLNSTIASANGCNVADQSSVTTLVRKFSSILSSPSVNCSPRRKRYCSEKFIELRQFWAQKAFENEK